MVLTLDPQLPPGGGELHVQSDHGWHSSQSAAERVEPGYLRHLLRKEFAEGPFDSMAGNYH